MSKRRVDPLQRARAAQEKARQIVKDIEDAKNATNEIQLKTQKTRNLEKKPVQTPQEALKRKASGNITPPPPSKYDAPCAQPPKPSQTTVSSNWRDAGPPQPYQDPNPRPPKIQRTEQTQQQKQFSFFGFFNAEQTPPQEQFNLFGLIGDLFNSQTSSPPPPTTSRLSPPPPSLSNPSPSPTPRGEFNPNPQLIGYFIDKHNPTNDHDLYNYINACDYLKKNIHFRDDLENALNSQISLKEKDNQRQQIIDRFHNVLNFNNKEYEAYKSAITKDCRKITKKIADEAKKHDLAIEISNSKIQDRINRQKIAQAYEETRAQKNPLKNKLDRLHHLLYNPNAENRLYLQGLSRHFNDNNIDINIFQKSEKTIQNKINPRIQNWNQKLKEFGIQTTDADTIKNLENYQRYLKRNIKELSTKASEVEEGKYNISASKLRDLYCLMAFHELELQKIEYANNWGKYVNKKMPDESATYKNNKIFEIIEKVPHKEYLLAGKNTFAEYYTYIKLPPLKIADNKRQNIPRYGPTAKPPSGQDEGGILGEMKRIATIHSDRAENLIGRTFGIVIQSPDSDEDDPEQMRKELRRGDQWDRDRQNFEALQEGLSNTYSSVKTLALKALDQAGRRAGPPTMDRNSWLNIFAGPGNKGRSGR